MSIHGSSLKQKRHFDWNKFSKTLEDLKMQGDSLTYIKLFWNSVDTVLTLTLHPQNGIGEYKDLAVSSSILYVVVPPKVYTHYKIYEPAYDQLSRMLMNHLLKQGTITLEISPGVFHTLTKYKIEEDGFNLLTRIVLMEVHN